MTIPTADPSPLLALGLAVFPIPAGSKTAGPGWHHTITRDLDGWPNGANIGIACRASHIVGIDLDRHDIDGVAGFADVCTRWGQPRPNTLEVQTPNDGRHLLFGVPGGLVVPSVSGGTSRLGPGVDIRGPGRTLGSYLVGPGSIVGGRRYLIVNDVPIAPLPGWIAALIGRRTEEAR